MSPSSGDVKRKGQGQPRKLHRKPKVRSVGRDVAKEYVAILNWISRGYKTNSEAARSTASKRSS